MESLKPMVRFHLPFATVEETVFRSVSTYLLSQYLAEIAEENEEEGLTN